MNKTIVVFVGAVFSGIAFAGSFALRAQVDACPTIQNKAPVKATKTTQTTTQPTTTQPTTRTVTLEDAVELGLVPAPKEKRPVREPTLQTTQN